jgi:hypothetical protein
MSILLNSSDYPGVHQTGQSHVLDQYTARQTIYFLVKFQVLTVASINMTAFWDAVWCNVIETE